MNGNSKNVTASALAQAEDLLKIARRFSVDTYKRPIENEAELRKGILKACKGLPMILDAGCGVGESSYHLAIENPDSFILGVDKSESRVLRNNKFKKELPPNLLLLTADMQSVWPLLCKMKKVKEVSVEKQYILYPNPWPKMKGLKKRWYANPMLAFILELDSKIEIRSNWRVYLEDFQKVYRELGKGESSLGEFIPQSYLTPFERKYHQSGQALYRLLLENSRLANES